MNRETIKKLIDAEARVLPFNHHSVKVAMKIPPVNHESIVDPLNRFMSYGVREYGSDFLINRELLPPDHPYFIDAKSQDETGLINNETPDSDCSNTPESEGHSM